MQQSPAETDYELDTKYRSTVIVILAQVFFALALPAAAWFIKTDDSFNGANTTPLWVLIIFIAIGSFVLRRVLTSWDRYRNVKLLKGAKGLLSSLQINAIILAAFGELIAIVGFPAVMMGGDRFDSLRAAAAAAVVFAINFPRKSIWEKIVENLKEV